MGATRQTFKLGLQHAWFLVVLFCVPALMMPTATFAGEKDPVIAANEAFYEAFTNHDMEAMEKLWSKSNEIVVIHPGWPALKGRLHVMDSWRNILELGGAPPSIESIDARAYVFPDSAFVICYEDVGGSYLIATNVFVREEGEWRMVHHQAAPAPDRIPEGRPL